VLNDTVAGQIKFYQIKIDWRVINEKALILKALAENPLMYIKGLLI
jgi:hypothetical protein